MATAMRAELILFLVLSLATPAFAAYESGPVGPYNVSFDMNTTMEYRVIVEAPTHGISTGIDFTRYNLTVDSADYGTYLMLTRYEQPMPADITANMGIVLAALQGAGADQPTIYQNITIDAKPAVLGNFRFERQFLGQGQYQEGELIVAAIYSPDAKVYEDGVYRGRTDCRVISTFPWENIRDLLYTLHVELPKEEGASIDQDSLSSPINQSSLTNQS